MWRDSGVCLFEQNLNHFLKVDYYKSFESADVDINRQTSIAWYTIYVRFHLMLFKLGRISQQSNGIYQTKISDYKNSTLMLN